MTDQPAELDANRCPLCGRENTCAVAQGQDPSSCWCIQAPTFPPELLERVPPPLRDVACICRECLEAAEGQRQT